MSIVGFNFTKISAERKNAVVGMVNINNSITLVDIADAKIGLSGDRGALRVSFTFTSDYTPELATMTMAGDVLILVDSKTQAGVLESWSKSKQLPREIAEPEMNHILERCNIQALLLSKDLNLPSPVPLPKVQVTMPGEAPKAKEGEAMKKLGDEPMKSTKVAKKK
jgi:hypothetical protein